MLTRARHCQDSVCYKQRYGIVWDQRHVLSMYVSPDTYVVCCILPSTDSVQSKVLKTAAVDIVVQ